MGDMAKLPKKKPIDQEIEESAINIVKTEWTNWDDAVCYVTEKVAFRMRELIRILRKNYWGVFDYPIDKQTDREKIWIGLAMSTVETWVKNIDLDQKDIGFIARKPEGYEITELTRLVVKDYLDRMYFGETLDADERQVLIDGTVVWKTWEDTSSGKSVMQRRTVDLLNFYIDPQEESIQKAYRVTERAIMLPSQIEQMSGWMNTRGLTGSQTINRNDGSRNSSFGTKTTGNYRDVWETWGKIPKWMVTKDKKAPDAYTEVDGHLIISGLESGEAVCHLVEENTRKDKFGNSYKPYEEWRACKIAGRWYGLGPVERILGLQEYLNTITNIRINRGYVSQLGLFKIKKGKGITPQMLSRLPVNGGLLVQDQDDVQHMAMPEIGQSSYNDEEVIKYWAQQMTSAQPISSGEILPASATATSSAISNTNAMTAYTLFKEGMGMFLERWIDRHAMPIISKSVKDGDIMRLMADDEKYKELVENVALDNVQRAMDEGDIVPSQGEVMQAVEAETERLLKSPQIFVKSTQKVMSEMLDTKAKITNEDLDTSVTVANLIQIMQIAPEYKEQITRQIYDLMGLSMPKLPKALPTAGPMGEAPANPQMTDIMTDSLLTGQTAQ